MTIVYYETTNEITTDTDNSIIFDGGLLKLHEYDNNQILVVKIVNKNKNYSEKVMLITRVELLFWDFTRRSTFHHNTNDALKYCNSFFI